MSLKFKTNRIIHEYAALANENRPLLELIIDLSFHVEEEYKKNLTITHLYRTEEEQDYFYRSNSKYQKKPWKSPHQVYAALDLRSRTFTKEEREHITEYLNKKYNPTNYFRFTAKVHDIGHGEHWHVQYKKKT